MVDPVDENANQSDVDITNLHLHLFDEIVSMLTLRAQSRTKILMWKKVRMKMLKIIMKLVG